MQTKREHSVHVRLSDEGDAGEGRGMTQDAAGQAVHTCVLRCAQAFDSPAVALATPCESKPAPPLTRTLVAPPSAIRIALWSDGELHIERDTGSGAADVVLLSADETRALVRYLDRMAVREGDLA